MTISLREKRFRRMITTRAVIVGALFLLITGRAYLTSLDLAEIATSGQAEGELFAKLRECRPPKGGWTQEALDRCVQDFFRAQEPKGLRYVATAILKPGEPFEGIHKARLFSEAGKRLSPYDLDLDESARGRPIPIEDRYVYILPPNLYARAPVHVLEFEPLRARALQRDGLFTLLVGILGVAVLIRGSFRMLSLLREREKAEKLAREREKLAALGQMSAVMAHELRNPLASAKGHSQLMAEMAEPGTRLQRKAEQVVQELLRVERLTDDLLAFVRSGKVNRRECDPAALAREVAERTVIAAPVEVKTEGAPKLWSLDEHAMERVLLNLLRNAAQAQGESREPIELWVRQEGEELYFAVRDHGSGVKEDVDVFAPFVTTRSSGTGLGLAVSRQSVEAHGGRISLKNHPEGGAIAEIFIPAGEAPPPADTLT